MKNKRKGAPKASQIVNQYLHNSSDRLIEIKININWDEAQCWACGCSKNQEEHKRQSCDTTNAGGYEWWNSASKSHKYNGGFLEKAHITPHSLGGPEGPENYALLCKNCHNESPDTKFPEMFQKWIDSKKDFRESMVYSEVRRVIKTYELTNQDFNIIADPQYGDDLSRFMKENALLSYKINFNTVCSIIGAFAKDKKVKATSPEWRNRYPHIGKEGIVLALTMMYKKQHGHKVKANLSKAKKQGKILGPRLAFCSRNKDNTENILTKEALLCIIKENSLRYAGLTWKGVAVELNKMGVKNTRGKPWKEHAVRQTTLALRNEFDLAWTSGSLF